MSEALALNRKGSVKRKLSPGLRFCTPFFETVVIEETISERRESYKSPELIDDCSITVFVVWNIADLELYHTQGRELAVPLIRQKIKNTLDLASASNVEHREIASFVRSAFRKETQPLEQIGVNYIRSYPRSGNCILK